MPRRISAERARVLDFLDTGSTPTPLPLGGEHGSASSQVRRAGRAQGQCRGVCAHRAREARSSGTWRRSRRRRGGCWRLQQWLQSHGCTHVVMEATGVYWKPVWHMLEEDFELVLANAAQVRNVPGRKSDINDATWLADLLAHGLIRASFVPPAPIQQMRDLTRTRKQLVREVAQHTQRIHKTSGGCQPQGGQRHHRHAGHDRPRHPRGAGGGADVTRSTWRTWRGAVSRPSVNSWWRPCMGVSPTTIASCSSSIWSQIDALNEAIDSLEDAHERRAGSHGAPALKC